MWGEVLRDEIAGGRLEFKDSYTDEGGAVTKSVQSFEYIDHQNTRQKMKAYIDVASKKPGQVTEGSLMLTDADPGFISLLKKTKLRRWDFRLQW